MRKWEIINAISAHHHHQSYLEIGLATGENFLKVKTPIKVSVDPDPQPPGDLKPTYRMSSHDFFAEYPEKTFDIILIDGSHHHEDVIIDFNYAMSRLNPDGVILLHDCNPQLEEEATEVRSTGRWNGTVWKAIAYLRMWKSGFQLWTVDTDEGVGIVRKADYHWFNRNFDGVALPEITWAWWVENRSKILNLITPEQFTELLNKNYQGYDPC